MNETPQTLTDAGTLAPDELVDEMVKRRLAEPDATSGYILVSQRSGFGCLTDSRESAPLYGTGASLAEG